MSAFRIDVYNAAGTKLNWFDQLSGVSITRRASRLGELRFSVPQLVALDRGVQRGRVYKLYHRADGLIGTFYHSSQELDTSGNVLTVTCHDQMIELTRKTVGFNWVFNGETMASAMGRIVSRFGGGWSVTTDHSGGDFYEFSYDTAGESYFALAEVARRTQAGWFALSGDKQIKYGRWLDSRLSGAIAARLVDSNMPASWTDGGNSLITEIGVSEDSGSITNRVVAVGQGLGVAQLSLFYSDETAPYTINSRKNWDGDNEDGTNSAGALTSEYYIEDADSIAEYGLYEAAVHFDVKPVTNSKADLLNAGNALYTAAVAYLLRSRYPLTNYTLSCIGLPKTVAPGDVVEVDYRNVASIIDSSGNAVRKVRLRLDKKRLFVAEVAHDFDEVGGVRKSRLLVSNTGETLADANEITTELLRDAKRFRLRPAPSISNLEDSGPTRPIKNGVVWPHKLKIGTDVLEINECKFVFYVSALIASATTTTTAPSSTQTSSSGGESTQTSSSGGSSTPTSSSGGSSTVASNSAGNGITFYATGEGFLAPGVSFNATSSGGSSNTGSTTPGSTGGVDGRNPSDIIGTTHTYENHSHSSASHTHTTPAHTHSLSEHFHHYYLQPHTHTVSISSHTHTVSISAHTHTVSIPAHSHTVTVPAHNHDLVFGVVEDTNTPTGVSVWLDGVQITPIKNYETGEFAGNTISAVGSYYVDFINALQGMGDWRGPHDIEVKCTGGQGMIFGKVKGRITIQPIRVAE
jgi:hypothetical protein